MSPAPALPFWKIVHVLAKRVEAWGIFLFHAATDALCGKAPNIYMGERLPPRAEGMSCVFAQTSILPAWRVAVERESGLAEKEGRHLPQIRGLVWDNGQEGGRIICSSNFGRMRILSPADTLSIYALPFDLACLHRVSDLTEAEEREAARRIEQDREEQA